MTAFGVTLIVAFLSICFNCFLIWYVIFLARKLFFISSRLSDVFLTFRSFEVFTENLYGMELFYGEPIIQELVHKTKMVIEEVESFRDVFEYTLDKELEEEIDAKAPEEKAQ